MSIAKHCSLYLSNKFLLIKCIITIAHRNHFIGGIMSPFRKKSSNYIVKL